MLVDPFGVTSRFYELRNHPNQEMTMKKKKLRNKCANPSGELTKPRLTYTSPVYHDDTELQRTRTEAANVNLLSCFVSRNPF